MVLIILWDRALLLVSFIFVVGLCSAAYLQVSPTYYSATAMVLFDPVKLSQSPNAKIPEYRLVSEVEIARSDQILLQAIRSIQLTPDDVLPAKTQLSVIERFFPGLIAAVQPINDASLLKYLQSNITITRAGDSNILNFRAVSTDPQLSTQLANGVAEAYIYQQLTSKIDSMSVALTALSEASDSVQNRVEETQELLSRYLRSNATSIAQQTGSTKVAELSARLNQNESKNQNLHRQIHRLEALVRANDYLTLAEELVAQLTRPATASSSEDLVQNLIDLRQQLQQFGIQPEQSLGATQSLPDEVVQLTNIASERLTSLNAEILQNTTQAIQLNSQLQQEIFRNELPPAIATELFSLQSQAQSAQNQYAQLVEQTENLNLQSQTEIADSRIVSQAIPGDGRETHSMLTLPILIFVGSIIVAVLIVLWDLLFAGYRSVALVNETLRTSDTLRFTARVSGKGKPNSTVMSWLQKSAHQTRAIRSKIELTRENLNTAPTIFLTSSMKNEGAEFAALSLAMNCSASGHSVALIDLNFSNPELMKILNFPPNEDLFNFLMDGSEWPAPCQIPTLNGKQIDIYAPNKGSIDQELLFSDHLDALLTALSQRYAYVILLSPPVATPSTWRILSQHASHILFTIRRGQTGKRNVLQNYQTILDTAPTSPSIPILTDLRYAPLMGWLGAPIFAS